MPGVDIDVGNFNITGFIFWFFDFFYLRFDEGRGLSQAPSQPVLKTAGEFWASVTLDKTP